MTAAEVVELVREYQAAYESWRDGDGLCGIDRWNAASLALMMADLPAPPADPQEAR